MLPLQAASRKAHRALPQDAFLRDQQGVNKTHSWIKYCPRRTCWQKHSWRPASVLRTSTLENDCRLPHPDRLPVAEETQRTKPKHFSKLDPISSKHAASCMAISLKFRNKGIFFPRSCIPRVFLLPLGFTWKLENENQTQWPKGDEACLFSPLCFSAHA